jgi:hypothetical protein
MALHQLAAQIQAEPDTSDAPLARVVGAKRLRPYLRPFRDSLPLCAAAYPETVGAGPPLRAIAVHLLRGCDQTVQCGHPCVTGP